MFSMFQAFCKWTGTQTVPAKSAQSIFDTDKATDIIILCNEYFNKNYPSSY